MKIYLFSTTFILLSHAHALDVKKDIHPIPGWNDIFTAQGYFYEKEFNLLVDTGTSYSILRKDLIEEIKSLDSNLKIKTLFSDFLKQDLLYADKVNFYLDENHIYPSRIGFSDLIKNLPFEIDGILGFEYLYNTGFKVNFQDKVLTLNPENIYGNKIKLKVKDYSPKIEAIINNCKFSILIDTGSTKSSLKEDDWNNLLKCGTTKLYREDIYASNALQSIHEKTVEKGEFDIKIGNLTSKIILSKSHGPHANINLLGNDLLKDYEMIIPKKSKYVYLNKIEKQE